MWVRVRSRRLIRTVCRIDYCVLPQHTCTNPDHRRSQCPEPPFTEESPCPERQQRSDAEGEVFLALLARLNVQQQACSADVIVGLSKHLADYAGRAWCVLEAYVALSRPTADTLGGRPGPKWEAAHAVADDFLHHLLNAAACVLLGPRLVLTHYDESRGWSPVRCDGCGTVEARNLALPQADGTTKAVEEVYIEEHRRHCQGRRDASSSSSSALGARVHPQLQALQALLPAAVALASRDDAAALQTVVGWLLAQRRHTRLEMAQDVERALHALRCDGRPFRARLAPEVSARAQWVTQFARGGDVQRGPLADVAGAGRTFGASDDLRPQLALVGRKAHQFENDADFEAAAAEADALARNEIKAKDATTLKAVAARLGLKATNKADLGVVVAKMVAHLRATVAAAVAPDAVLGPLGQVGLGGRGCGVVFEGWCGRVLCTTRCSAKATRRCSTGW